MLFNLLTIQTYNELLVTRIKGINHHSKNIVDVNIAFYAILKLLISPKLVLSGSTKICGIIFPSTQTAGDAICYDQQYIMRPKSVRYANCIWHFSIKTDSWLSGKLYVVGTLSNLGLIL